MARRKQTALQKEYNKQVARVNAVYNEMKRQGIDVADVQKAFNNAYKGQRASRKKIKELQTEWTAKKARAEAGLVKQKGVYRPAKITGVSYEKGRFVQTGKKTGKQRLKSYIPETTRSGPPTKGDLILDELLSLIDEVPSQASYAIRDELSRQIQLYGRETVTEALGQLPPEFVEECRATIRYDYSTIETARQIRRISEAITGEVLKVEQRLAIQEASDMSAEAESYGL